MQRRIRTVGWALLALAVVVVAVVVTVGALRAHGDAAFNRWVGWATVSAVPVAAIGVVLVLWEKIASGEATTENKIGEIEDELAAVILAQAQVARSQLIGTDEAGDQAANVRFVKGGGRFREVSGASEGDLASVLEYYRSLSPGRLVVLGEPGAGKTVLALQLLIRLLDQRQNDPDAPVPVLISAAAYDTEIPWPEWLAGHLAQRFSISTRAAGGLVRDGRILPLVDGVDEMDSAGRQDRAQVLVTALNTSMRGLERAPAVVTCRKAEYQVLRRGVDRAAHIEMVPLTAAEAAEYLRGQFLRQDEQDRWEPVLAVLDADPDGPLAGQLTTPWRLTLALATFRDGGDPVQLLPLAPVPTSRTGEYAQRVDQLLLDGYVSAAVRLHDPAGRYPQAQVLHWLMALADGLAQQARHGGSATDIRLDQWWQATARNAARVTHLAMAAAPSVGLGITWAVARNPGLAWFILPASLPIVTAGSAPHPHRLKARLIAAHRILRGASVWAGLGAGLGAWLAAGPVVGLVSGLVTMLTLALIMGLDDSSAQALGPRDVIRADGRYGLVVAIMAGLAAGLVFGLAAGLGLGAGLLAPESTPGLGVRLALVLGLGAGLVGGLTAGPGYGASAWTRYHISVATMAIRQQGPLRYSAFLDWAQQAGLLRVSGIAYQFRHRQLQDWLGSRA